MRHDFNADILDETAHRPWPMPREPWIMTQTWHDLLFAHWPIEPAAIARLLPPALELDTFDGSAWVGVVPFWMSNVAPRGFPALPWLSTFPELNVRTYVRRRGERPGVFFFSLDATNAAAVATARLVFHLPYYRARMESRPVGDRIEYASRRVASGAPAASLRAVYGPSGLPAAPVSGTLEHFLTERYCLYTVDGARRPRRLEIHHPPWPLQPATAVIVENTMASAAGIVLPDRPPLLHFARRQDMVAWRLKPID